VLDVAGYYRQGDIALEATEAVIGASVEPVDFERIDRRLHRRVPVAQADKLRGLLARLVRDRQIALLGQDHPIQDII
jgi:hypothetical protein